MDRFPIVRTEIRTDLRDYPVDLRELADAIDFHVAYLRTAIRIDVLYGDHCSMLTVHYRRADRPRDAIRAGEKACMIFSEFNEKRKLLIAKIRLAHSHQWARDFLLSEQIFKTCFDDIRDDNSLWPWLDFTWQHYGKCLFDQEKYEPALEAFEQAMGLRQDKGDSDLIASTALAIEQTLARLGRSELK